MSYVVDNCSYDPFLIVVGVIITLHEIGLRNLRLGSRPERVRARRRRSWLFHGGLAVLLLAVVSPTDYWAGDYFFVHMVEHILIMFFAPVLIVAGAPWLPLVHVSRSRCGGGSGAVFLSSWATPVRALGRFLSNGIVAVVLFNAAMVIWHVPALFDAAQRNQAIHVWLMHSSFFVTGVLFWLQLFPSHPIKPKFSTLGGIWAILVTDGVMVVPAISLSLSSSTSWYPVYAHLPGVRLSPFADQQIGAAILWVCGDFSASPALVILISRAIREQGGGSALIARMLHGSSSSRRHRTADRRTEVTSRRSQRGKYPLERLGARRWPVTDRELENGRRRSRASGPASSSGR